MAKYITDEVIEVERLLGETLRIVRARYLGMELFILEVLHGDGREASVTPFLSLFGAQQAKQRHLQKRVQYYG